MKSSDLLEEIYKNGFERKDWTRVLQLLSITFDLLQFSLIKIKNEKNYELETISSYEIDSHTNLGGFAKEISSFSKCALFTTKLISVKNIQSGNKRQCKITINKVRIAFATPDSGDVSMISANPFAP